MTFDRRAWPKIIGFGAILAPALLAFAPIVRGGEVAEPDSVAASPVAVESAPTCRYFACVFGSQSKPKKAKYTHTFGYVVKATGFGDDLCSYELEVHPISWMPATREIKVLKFVPETGINLGLHETIEWALSTDQSIAQWGPYEVSASGYARSLNRIAQLQSGAVKYQCIDPLIFRAQRVSDCIHAISDMDQTADRLRYLLLRFGEAASKHIVRRLHSSGHLIDPHADHSWLDVRLGLDHYPIGHRPLPKLGVGGRIRRWRMKTRGR